MGEKSPNNDINKKSRTPLEWLGILAEKEYLRIKKNNNLLYYDFVKRGQYIEILKDVEFQYYYLNGDKIYICPHQSCEKTFPSFIRTQRHYLVHTGKKHFTCMFVNCGKKFSRKDNMLQHYKNHFLIN